jgi:hypothetical protein
MPAASVGYAPFASWPWPLAGDQPCPARGGVTATQDAAVAALEPGPRCPCPRP